jgi:hypothetical protein
MPRALILATVVFSGPNESRVLDLQEQLSPVHPQQDQPITQQNRCASEEWLQAGSGELEKIRTQVDAQAAVKKSPQKMCDTVRSDRIHADHNQRVGPFFEGSRLNYPGEGGQEQEADASAENCPRRRPDSFHHWAEVRVMQSKPERN